ncbi:hypothetical protein [Deinococcus sp.]|nr:hypothetical protein [Deinococcus sp.]
MYRKMLVGVLLFTMLAASCGQSGGGTGGSFWNAATWNSSTWK